MPQNENDNENKNNNNHHSQMSFGWIQSKTCLIDMNYCAFGQKETMERKQYIISTDHGKNSIKFIIIISEV